jgi:hypothetical protein
LGEEQVNFTEKLAGAVRRNKSLVCVGLDPDPELMPEKLSVSEFNKAIIDATADMVCAFTIQSYPRQAVLIAYKRYAGYPLDKTEQNYLTHFRKKTQKG